MSRLTDARLAAGNLTIVGVSIETKISVHLILHGRRRVPAVIAARKECARRLKASGWSYPQIGMILRKDHSTVQYYLKGRSHSPSLAPAQNVDFTG